MEQSRLPRLDARPTINAWLPDESLFSLCSRHHSLSCNVLASDSCWQLFGHPRMGTAHDFPARLGEFASRNEGALGSAREIIRHRTLLPYYFPFRLARDAADAVAAVTAGGIGGLKGRLGILAARFGASHPLKACRECMRADLAEHHAAYWHLQHQLPGVWICPLHRSALSWARSKVNGADRFQWMLPSPDQLVDGITANAHQSLSAPLLRLGECAIGLHALPDGFHFAPDRLAAALRLRAISKGLLSESGRLGRARFASAILDVSVPLRCIHGLSALPQTADEAISQFARLLSGPRCVPHPLRYLVLALALFSTWQAFLDAYGATIVESSYRAVVDGGERAGRQVSAADAAEESRRTTLVTLMRGDRRSVTSSAKAVGVTVATAMAWAAAAGIVVSRRPKRLKEPLRRRVVRELQRGSSKQAVAEAFRLSVQTVTTLLRTEVDLHSRWKEAQFVHAQRHARQSWRKTAARFGGSGIERLRSMQPAVYAWLYRNDRAWLEAFDADLPRAPRRYLGRVDWNVRDEAFSQAVRQAGVAICEHEQTKRASIARLCDAVPDLKPRLSDLDQLPLTRKAIADVTRRRRE